MENALNGIGYAKQCFQTVSYEAYLPNLTYNLNEGLPLTK